MRKIYFGKFDVNTKCIFSRKFHFCEKTKILPFELYWGLAHSLPLILVSGYTVLYRIHPAQPLGWVFINL